MSKIIGIDLGGTSIKFAILTQEGEIQESGSLNQYLRWRLDDWVYSTSFGTCRDLRDWMIGVDREMDGNRCLQSLNWKTCSRWKRKSKSNRHFIFHWQRCQCCCPWWALDGSWRQSARCCLMTLGTGTGVGGGIVAEGKLCTTCWSSRRAWSHHVGGLWSANSVYLRQERLLGNCCICDWIVNLTRRYADEYAGNAELKNWLITVKMSTLKLYLT